MILCQDEKTSAKELVQMNFIHKFEKVRPCYQCLV